MSVLTLTIGDCAVTVDAEAWESTKSVVVGKNAVLVTAKPSSLRWSVLKQRHTSYVVAYQTSPKSLLLHRLLTECPVGMFCDHKDGNGLNNTASNLRVCSLAENNANRRPKPHSSRFVGVQKARRVRKPGFVAKCFLHGRNFNLGVFSTEEEAAAARDAFVAANKPTGFLNRDILAAEAQQIALGLPVSELSGKGK